MDELIGLRQTIEDQATVIAQLKTELTEARDTCHMTQSETAALRDEIRQAYYGEGSYWGSAALRLYHLFLTVFSKKPRHL